MENRRDINGHSGYGALVFGLCLWFLLLLYKELFNTMRQHPSYQLQKSSIMKEE